MFIFIISISISRRFDSGLYVQNLWNVMSISVHTHTDLYGERIYYREKQIDIALIEKWKGDIYFNKA